MNIKREKPSGFNFNPSGFHSGTFSAIACTAWAAATRVSQFLLRKYTNT